MLEKHDLPVANHDGPQALTLRATQRFPGLAGQIREFSDIYLATRFGRAATTASKATLRDLSRRLRALEQASRAARR
jgi:hypothetical protein